MQTQCLLIQKQRVVQLTLFMADDAQIEQGFHVVGLDSQGLLERLARLPDSPVFAQCKTQIVMSLRAVRCQPESLAIAGGRFVDAASRRQGVAQVGVDLGIVGFDLQDLTIAGGCRRELT